MNKEHKVVTTGEQIDAGLARAREFAADDRRVRKAAYVRKGDQVRLFLANGITVSIPRRRLQGLENAQPAQLSQIELLGGGTGLHWPRLDVSHYVLGLLNDVFGTKQWMAHLGRLGGASRSRSKTAAARINGQKGGRPRKTRKPVIATAGQRFHEKLRRA